MTDRTEREQLADGYTPGPWTYDEYADMIFAANGQSHVADICEVRGWGELSTTLGPEKARERQRANGLLIAAAPEMFEELKRLRLEVAALRSDTRETPHD